MWADIPARANSTDLPARCPLTYFPGGDMPSEDEARNVAPRSAAFWAYLGIVGGTGIALIAVSLMHLGTNDFTLMGGSFLAVAVLLVLGELRPVMTAGSPDTDGVSISTTFVFALLIHWGLGVAVLMQTIATILA